MPSVDDTACVFYLRNARRRHVNPVSRHLTQTSSGRTRNRRSHDIVWSHSASPDVEIYLSSWLFCSLYSGNTLVPSSAIGSQAGLNCH